MNEENFMAGIINATQTTPDPVPAPVAEPDQQPAATPVQPVQPVVEEPVNLEETFDKSNKAFAEQRIRNKQLEDLMTRFAKTAGIDTAKGDDIYSKLNGLVTQKEAENASINPALLKTLQEQETRLAAYEQEEIKKEANIAFNGVKSKFGLTGSELIEFSKQLSSNGVNPFTQRGINLEHQYMLMNFDNLISKAVEKGRAEEAERRDRLAQSTAPSNQVGGKSFENDAVATASDGYEALRNLFSKKG